MDDYIFTHVKHIDPFVQKDDIEELSFINEFDLFVKFKDGRKYIYDTYHKNFSGFYPESHELTDEEWYRSFKIRLRKIMNRNNVTQDELADNLNLSRRTISRYVNGETIPDALMLKKISLALGCPLDEFFYKYY